MARIPTRVLLALTLLLFGTTMTSAQSLGPFSWQLQPYCNVLTINVTPTGGVFALDGFDNQCSATTRASLTGTAFQNPDGTIGLGFAVVMAPGGAPVHIDATVSLPSASGTWRDSAGHAGMFAFGVAAGGPPRPRLSGAGDDLVVTEYNGGGAIRVRRANGSAEAPLAIQPGQRLGLFGAQGHDGTSFTFTQAAVVFDATETYTSLARGTQMEFLTTANGTTGVASRMVIDHDGEVGIGTTVPLNLLHVNGDVRIGSCVYSTNGSLACVSDARFKRDITPLPAMLDRLSALEPVRYAWRADEFPERGFGAGRSTGLIAQDVERVLPELVTMEADGYKAVSYSDLPLLAIQAIKELKEKNDALERRLAALEAAASPRR